MQSKPYRHNPKTLRAITACSILLTGLLVSRQDWFGDDESADDAAPIVIVFPRPAQEAAVNPEDAATAATDVEGSRSSADAGNVLADLVAAGEFRRASAILMKRAAAAATANDHRALGANLLQLGRIAVAEQDLDSAEVFLLEALDLAREHGDERAMAHVNHELGRTHLRARQLARKAGQAYDTLLVARNELDRGDYASSGEKLSRVIEENLAIRRYGAAASAYESLASLYRALHDGYLAELALVEAARLYASAGSDQRAGLVLRELQRSGIDEGGIHRLSSELSSLSARFRNDVALMERARDYQRLYRHYLAAGDNERAWQLRLLSSQSLARTNRRTLYHRHADVLAVLYDSNRAMELARNYFGQASSQFDNQGLTDLANRSRALTATVY